MTLQEISGLSVEPCEGESLIVTVFEISKSIVCIDVEVMSNMYTLHSMFDMNIDLVFFLLCYDQIPAYLEREIEYRFLAVRCRIVS